jgi:hypothetical protein
VNAGQLLRAGGMDSVRVRLIVDPVDPEKVLVRSAPRLMRRFWGQGISAMTFPNKIYIDPVALSARNGPGLLLVHELIHVRQWDQLGVFRFLWRYLTAYFGGRFRRLGHRAAYLAIPLEVEARAAARLKYAAPPS